MILHPISKSNQSPFDRFTVQMQQVGESKTQPPSHKVVLLGDSRVGKTSILARQMLGYQPPTQGPTIGCHYSEIRVTVDNQPVVLHVWDTAGQEMYRALVPVYLRGAQAALLVYDVTDRESFKSLGHWRDTLMDVVPPNTVVCIVGNKIDLEGEAVVDDDQARQFANQYGAKLFKVSAATGQGLDALFNEIATKILEGEEADQTATAMNLEGHEEKKGGCC